MEDPAMASVPVLIALHQVDTLSSQSASQAPSTPKTPVSSTPQDTNFHAVVDLEELEERARLWWGSRIAGLKVDASIAPAEEAELSSKSKAQSAADPSSPKPKDMKPPSTPSSPRIDQPERIWDVVCTSAQDRCVGPHACLELFSN
jgi:hypothetical protein